MGSRGGRMGVEEKGLRQEREIRETRRGVE